MVSTGCSALDCAGCGVRPASGCGRRCVCWATTGRMPRARRTAYRPVCSSCSRVRSSECCGGNQLRMIASGASSAYRSRTIDEQRGVRRQLEGGGGALVGDDLVGRETVGPRVRPSRVAGRRTGWSARPCGAPCGSRPWCRGRAGARSRPWSTSSGMARRTVGRDRSSRSASADLVLERVARAAACRR